MEIISTISEMKSVVRQARIKGQSIGFVPTMGYLHQGHLELISRARRENDLVIVSIFVNPLQFGPTEDYEKYPRDTEADSQKAESAGCDIIFLPEAGEMYPAGYSSFVEVEGIDQVLCGASRPGHFKGVATVVNKLFHIVAPTRAYFGQKDAQQALLIQKMVSDLSMDVEVIVAPTVREADGLAMSSRNSYLTHHERQAASVLYKSLNAAKELIAAGERNPQKITGLIFDLLQNEPLANIDYVEVVDASTLKNFEQVLSNRVLIALAVRIGKTRLIDNLIMDLEV